LRGLAFAHGKGIVHRDLKPANVFLQELPDQADHVRLLDFGMVKFLEKADSGPMADTLTRAGVVFGTPAYLSPEQAKGGPADARLSALEAVITKLPAAALKAGRRKPTPRPLRVVAAPSRFWRRALMVVAVGMGVGAAAVYLRLRHDGTKPVETAALPAAKAR